MASDDDGRVVSDEEMIDRWMRGQRKADIARAYGVSRQRIDQRLKRHGIGGPNRNALPEAEQLLNAAQSAFTMDGLATSVKLTPGALEIALNKHGLRYKVTEILESNRRVRTAQQRLRERQPYVGRLRAIAKRVRHTPTTAELGAEKIFHARLAQLFGSASEAMRAAGLIPNERGSPPAPLPIDFGSDEAPTVDEVELRERANRILFAGALSEPPVGDPSPDKKCVMSEAYYRDPAVVAWALQNAGGKCEACGAVGYETDNGTLFLEVHHLVPLSAGGADTVNNAIAVCETCHGKLHRWVGRHGMQADLVRRIHRSSDAPPLPRF